MADIARAPETIRHEGRWWEGKSDHRLAGVFEGGGAKGVAYVGALEAVVRRKCWFSAVAGASAGAITATLVAAGLKPSQIRDESLAMLKRFPQRLNLATALIRLWWHDQAIPDQELRVWLQKLLVARVKELGEKLDPCRGCTGSGIRGDDTCQYCLGSGVEPITFAKLHSASGIELHVVAADLCSHQIVVFNHILSPGCQVHEAVLASSAIPFVFRHARLATQERANHRDYHLIVDGGVASNFPMFVFTDEAFQETCSEAQYEKVIGFLLDEGRPGAGDLTHSAFVPSGLWKEWGGKPSIDAPGLSGHQETPRGLSARVGKAIALLVTEPLAWIARTGAVLTKGRLPPRWAVPSNRVLRNLIDIVDGTSATLGPPLFASIIGYAIVQGTSLYAVQELWPDLFEGRWADNLTTKIYTVVALAGIALTISLIPVVIMLNVLASDTIRWIGPGLISTYFATPGAPVWARESRNVVAVKIPETIGALRFDMTTSEIHGLWDEARTKTFKVLDGFEMIACLPEDEARDLIAHENTAMSREVGASPSAATS